MVRLLICVGIGALFSGRVMAAPSDVFGMGAREAGMAQAGIFSLPTTYSARGNPALLPWAPKSLGMEAAGQFYSLDDANIRSTNTAAVSSGIPRDNHRASKAGPSQSGSIGVSVPLGKKIAVGLAGRFPGDSVAKIHAFTQNEANYLNFNERQARPEIFTGAGLALSPSISLGGGLFYSLKAKGTMQLGISQTDAESRILLDLAPEFVPYVGAAVRKHLSGSRELLIGLSHRFEQKAKSRLEIDVDFDIGLGTIPFSTISELVSFYDPAVSGVGATYRTSRSIWSLSYEFSQWSKYRAPIMSLSGKDLDTLNNGRTSVSSVKLKDTHSARFGFELPEYLRRLDFRAGLEYHTSAVAKDTNNITLVDSDRWAIGLGQSLHIDPPRHWMDKPFMVDFAVKYIGLMERTFQDNLKGGQRQSRSGGGALAVGLGVRFDL